MLVFLSIRSSNITVGLGDSQSIDLLFSLGHFAVENRCNAKKRVCFSRTESRVDSRVHNSVRCQDAGVKREVKEGWATSRLLSGGPGGPVFSEPSSLSPSRPIINA